jgi:hypothetical protein
MTVMEDDGPTSRRARLARVRRGRRLQILVLAVVLIAGGATAYAVGRDRDPSAAQPGVTTLPSTTTTGPYGSLPYGGTVAPTKTSHAPRRKLSHEDPLRVWVGGDSLSGELGPSLGNLLAPSGVVKVTVDFKVGSGLHDNGLRNWPERVPSQMADTNPDVAIFMIGANDASIVGGYESSWAPGYRDKVSRLMDALVGDHHRRVLWVGPPTLRDSTLDRGAKALSALMRDEAKAHPDVTFVDAYSMFSAPSGGYTNHLDLSALTTSPAFGAQVAAGSLADVLVRISDGVHFTDNGATWIAYNVAKLLDAEWKIVAQSGGKPISVTIESGGGDIPGYQPPQSSSQWHPSSTTTGYGSSGTGAPTSTVPVTAPVTTVAPTTAAPTTVAPTTSPTTSATPTT